MSTSVKIYIHSIISDHADILTQSTNIPILTLSDRKEDETRKKKKKWNDW